MCIQILYICNLYAYTFVFRTPLLHLHHVRVRAQSIQPLLYIFLPSLQRCVYTDVKVIYAYTLQCLLQYIHFEYFCIYCFVFRTPLLHLHHVRVRAQSIQPLLYIFLPSLQRYTVQYIIGLLSLSIITYIMITICIYTSLPTL